jgi:hypothetical protein
MKKILPICESLIFTEQKQLMLFCNTDARNECAFLLLREYLGITLDGETT